VALRTEIGAVRGFVKTKVTSRISPGPDTGIEIDGSSQYLPGGTDSSDAPGSDRTEHKSKILNNRL